jgi:hypothetical protein
MIFSTHGDRTHLRVWALLPSVVNGTACADERTDVERHLSCCTACREELAFQQQLLAAMTSSPATVGPDLEAGLERLFERIDGHAGEQRRPRALPLRWMQHPSASALAYGLAALLVLGAGGTALFRSGLGDAVRPAVYRTLSSGSPALTQPGTPRATIRLVVDAAMPIGRLQALLASLGLQIVGGPGANGIYSLAPAAGEAKGNLAEQIDTLRATPGVRFAEPIEYGGS